MRDPLTLGTSLAKSLRPNMQLWQGELPPEIDLKEEVSSRGLRFLSCSYSQRTLPRVERARASAVPVELLLSKMRLTDAKFESWLARTSVRLRGCD